MRRLFYLGNRLPNKVVRGAAGVCEVEFGSLTDAESKGINRRDRGERRVRINKTDLINAFRLSLGFFSTSSPRTPRFASESGSLAFLDFAILPRAVVDDWR